MDRWRNPAGVGGRARPVVFYAVAAIVCDVLVAVAAWADWRALLATPRSALLNPEDDLRYAVTGFGYVAASLLRYVVLVALVVALTRLARDGRRHDTGRSPRSSLAWLFAVALVVVEVGYVALASDQAGSNGAWSAERIAMCVLSALIAVASVVLARMSDRAGMSDVVPEQAPA